MINPWASDETASAYNGPFSHKAETHAFVIGFYYGLRHAGPPFRIVRKWNEDVAAEPHYFKGGYACGVLLKALVVLKIAREFRRVMAASPRD